MFIALQYTIKHLLKKSYSYFCLFSRQNYYTKLLKLVSISKKVYFFVIFLIFRIHSSLARKVTENFGDMQENGDFSPFSV